MARRAGDVVVVVGGGIIGCAVAYYLARAGMSVTIVERRSLGAGASGASGGSICHQDCTPAELPLAKRAAEIWPSLSEELGTDVEYQTTGSLLLASNEASALQLGEQATRQRQAGLDVRVVRGPELSALALALGPDFQVGVYSASDGVANPLMTLRAFALAARRAGARLYTGYEATGLRVAVDRVGGIETSRGVLACDYVVNTTGAWAAPLGGDASVSPSIQARATQRIELEAAPIQLGPVLVSPDRRLTIYQTRDRHVHLGGPWPAACDLKSGTASPLPESIRDQTREARQLLPELRLLAALRLVAGIDGLTPDELPIIGPSPDVDGYCLCLGFGSRGFGLAPAVGTLVAELVTTGRVPTQLEPFGLARFGGGG